MSNKYDILIKFADGTEKIVTDVTDYGYIDEHMYFYDKNSRRNFLTAAYVTFIGVNEDYN